MMWLLVPILVVALVSMVLNAAYILHELGWFPHGKYRGPVSFVAETKHGGYWPSSQERRRNDARVAFQSPYVKILRRYVHSDLFAESDLQAQIMRMLERWRERPTLGRMDDLIEVMNGITTVEEVSTEVHGLVDEAVREILGCDVGLFTQRGSHV